ncbi:MAG: cell division protein FtsX [Janthinobacterium lividum]
MTRSLLRPPGFDDLGVRRALSDRLLPCLVAAMTFLAALALAGAVGATALAQHWQSGAGGMITVQVPQPGDSIASTTRLDRVRAALAATAGIAGTRTLSDDQLRVLLRPWLGTTTGDISIPLPAVIDVQVAGAGPDRATLVAALETAAPGTLVEEHDRWVKRLATLARSLQACAALAFAVVAFVAVAVIAVATRAGLASRRDAIEIVHGLGATDQFIARSFAQRATVLAGIGAAIGAVAALPVLASLAGLAAPFGNAAAPDGIAGAVGSIPLTLWLSVLCLPPLAAAIGWLTAHRTVRRWLRRLP